MLKPDAGRPLVYPYPREISQTDGTITVSSISIDAEGPHAARAAGILAKRLREMGIAIGGPDAYRVTLCEDRCIANHIGDEGYTLTTSSDGAELSAATYAGLYYAVQTLLQLIRREADGAGLPQVEITDHPIKPIRGIHTYLPAREDLPFFKRFIEWLGSHKMNTMILEIGGGMEYKRHPEMNEAWERFCTEAMDYPGGPEALQASQWFAKDSTHTELAGGSYLLQDEVGLIRSWCEDNCIEIIPEVQSLSHAYYLVLAHPELAEVPQDPWPDNYCPSNPSSYELFFDVLDEVIDVLDPRIISLGHDEAYLFQFCEQCKQRDAAEIYATDIIKSHDYLAERGIRTAIWGDKLLEIHHENGQSYGGVERNTVRYGKPFHMPATNGCVDLIPRDVLVLDWYWSLSYDSARMLAEKGFEMIYGNYHSPNFKDWATHRENEALLGGETSLWSGADAYSIGRNGKLHSILWTASNLWSDFDPDADRQRLMDDIAAVLRYDRPWLTGTLSVIDAPSACGFTPVDLIPAAAMGMRGADPDHDFSVLPDGAMTLGGVDFTMPGDGPIPGVNWHTRATPPIPVGAAADALVFLHTTTIDHVHGPTYYTTTLEPDIIARYLVTYEDGEQAEIPLEWAVNIDAWGTHYMVGLSGDMSATIGAHVYAADPVIEGEGHTVFMYEWVNPYPDVPIRDLRLVWDAGYSKGIVALLAMTVVREG